MIFIVDCEPKRFDSLVVGRTNCQVDLRFYAAAYGVHRQRSFRHVFVVSFFFIIFSPSRGSRCVTARRLGANDADVGSDVYSVFSYNVERTAPPRQKACFNNKY